MREPDASASFQADADRIRGFIAQNPFFLAPMAGWTDIVYRTICKEFGAGLTCTEMVSAQGLAHMSVHTREYIQISDEEAPAAVQLFGSDPDVVSSQAAHVEQILGSKLAAIDINMGCPARKVVRKGEGSALMKTPELAARIVRQTSNAVEVPVTVKIRRGYDNHEETAVEFARAMQEAGAAAVCVHGRFSRDLYHGKADWGVIARVKAAVDIPVIASGDIFSARDTLNCMQQTGADAVAIARGAQGNPWIFSQARELLELARSGADVSNWKPQDISLDERIRVASMHAERLFAKDPRAVVHMRTYFAPYFKGVPAASKYRGEINSCNTLDDFIKFFERIGDEAASQ